MRSQANLCRTLDWGVGSRPAPGQAVSGDAHLVEPIGDDVLIAVIDGLGHGKAAAAAAYAAIASLRENAGQTLDKLIDRCHQALKPTRGAVMTLAIVASTDDRLTWVGIGNVEARLLRKRDEGIPNEEYLPLCGGLVGYQVPAAPVHTTYMAPGDLLVIFTDGVGESVAKDIPLDDSPQQIAEWILSRLFRGYDDGLVLVARRLGHSNESTSE